MTRRRERRRNVKRERQPTRASGRRVPFGAVLVALAVAAALAAVWLAWPRAKPAPARAWSAEELAHRFEGAAQKKDWVEAVHWGELLVPRADGRASVFDAVSGAWHNYAIIERRRHRYLRPALRTSLERWACEQRAIRYADSAFALAVTREERIAARFRRAGLLDVAGLHLDALADYEAIVREADHVIAASRVAGIRARMSDPSHPDHVTAEQIEAAIAKWR